ncbi:16S rRNA (guanine(966)-N(2))-methyltransferase RsmD [Helicobacter aurati]|uniref:16S rRNA (Guanine(966)-N(2))-methyltransferase RsmD n=1 Tax=Helicobacter aurati TaxID=137778 RepID=A0A3D8J9M3_9HELI|nr:16S rRNA (guanine(966)-N(2))-methyltransferase RsmD [Helicobacter aurati]RDU73806.1 16S rRNA (guanine(966)-N(2))-methyltransferase RsmD [Helicobacter aurati]
MSFTTTSTQKKKQIQSSFAIVGGRYKGVKLSLHSNATTRPTKALVKKSFFDSTQGIIPLCLFVECFAGSGQMGFEAISRGANKALFFEKDKKAYSNLQKNLQIFQDKCKKTSAFYEDKYIYNDYTEQQIESHCADFFESPHILEDSKKSAQQIIMYLDPPFPNHLPNEECNTSISTSQDIYRKIQDFIQTFSSSLLQKIHLIIIESMTSYPLYKQIGDFHLTKMSKFGKTTLAYFQH